MGADQSYKGPVSDRAWHADARKRGRVAIFNATRPDGLDGWTMDIRQYELMRTHILHMIDHESDADGAISLKRIVAASQERYSTHEVFPKGRVRNYCTFTKVDLEARCEIERLPGAGAQRMRRVQRDSAGEQT